MPWDNPLQLLRAVVQAPTKPKEWTKFHVWCVARGKHPAGRHHYRSTQPLKLCQGTASPQQIFMEWTHGTPQQHPSSKATDSGFLQCNKQAELFWECHTAGQVHPTPDRWLLWSGGRGVCASLNVPFVCLRGDCFGGPAFSMKTLFKKWIQGSTCEILGPYLH